MPHTHWKQIKRRIERAGGTVRRVGTSHLEVTGPAGKVRIGTEPGVNTTVMLRRYAGLEVNLRV